MSGDNIDKCDTSYCSISRESCYSIDIVDCRDVIDNRDSSDNKDRSDTSAMTYDD